MRANEEITEDDVIQMIQTENYILAYPPEELVKFYDTKEKYLLFLDTIVVISRINYGFFLLDSRIIESIRKVVNSRRDDYTSGINLECINSIIRMCNHIDSIDKKGKDFLVSNYVLYQSDARGMDISSIDQMIALIINDMLVYNAIKDNDWSNVKSVGFLLASLMYLISYIPGIISNEKYKQVIIDKLNSIKKKAGFFDIALKEYVKLVNNAISDIK